MQSLAPINQVANNSCLFCVYRKYGKTAEFCHNDKHFTNPEPIFFARMKCGGEWFTGKVGTTNENPRTT